MKKELVINCEKITLEIVDFLKREFKSRSKKTAILGLSGGLDSAIVAFLCKKAGLDLKVALLPYGYNPQGEDIVNAKKVIKALKLKDDQAVIIDIKPVVDFWVKFQTKILRVKVTQARKGNIMARERMIAQYDLAKHFNGLVVGTENLSEYYLGYFTLHGDQAADINPIHGLFKTQVYQLAKYLGVSHAIIKTAPSAGFWKGQTDEGELGFSYDGGDPVLYYYLIEKYPKKDLIKKAGFDKVLVEKVFKRIKNSQFKRDFVPSYKYYKD
jgi:NAD+ synthase